MHSEDDGPRQGIEARNALMGKTVFLGLITALSFVGTVVIFILLIERSHVVCTPARDTLSDPVCRSVKDGSIPALIALAAGLVQSTLLLVITQMSAALGRTISVVDELAARR